MKIAYIDHSFHKKTKSTDFLYEEINNQLNIKRVWDYRWQGGKAADLAKLKDEGYEALILFQVNFSREQLLYYGFDNTTFIPMYDGVKHWRVNEWQLCEHQKILSFSKEIHFRASALQFDSFYAQYAPLQEKKIEVHNDDLLKIFFWQRSKYITFDLIKKIFLPSQIESTNIHWSPDPGNDDVLKPKPNDDKIFSINYSTWFKSKQDYLDILKGKNVFIQSRLNEGIGQAFLEAMSYGLVVVSPNEPTMNEYITHGINGLLYNHLKPIRLQKFNLSKISYNAWKTCYTIHQNWKKRSPMLLDFIIRSPKKNVVSKYFVPILSVDNTLFMTDLLIRNKNISKAIKYCNLARRFAVNKNEKKRVYQRLAKINYDQKTKKWKLYARNYLNYIETKNCSINEFIASLEWSKRLECKKSYSFFIKEFYKAVLRSTKKEEINTYIWALKYGEIIERLGKINIAKIWYDKAFLILKKNQKCLNLIINIYHYASLAKKIGELNDSKKYFNIILKSYPYFSEKSKVLFHLGEIAFMERKYSTANKYLQNCIELCPNHIKAKEYLNKMR